ncbi:NAD(P)-dependent oxidoreductase [Xylocopilactobacillus apis]|uniref:NADH-flavin reductase n=1 Tax=Xylocopilactobacillus apis TaxID=2932183 RepID=A0AAU9DU11_9LACO|nr:NAD(P)H-binding protein [Xylocopilactobacillus apis]BDR57318.1 NADH-flavin reductase [Xylocopilactobacillus apis]
MNLAIIGATGMAGLEVTSLAVQRGHQVLAIATNSDHLNKLKEEVPQVETLRKDAFDLTKDDFNGIDIIVNAFAVTPTKAHLHLELAQKLVDLFQGDDHTRLFFILGAASLKKSEKDDDLVLDMIEQDPNSASFIAIPRAQKQELDFLRTAVSINWVGVSPALTFQPGPASKNYLIGKDVLLKNDQGQSVTSSKTMALAILNEIESPHYHNERFTVADA